MRKIYSLLTALALTVSAFAGTGTTVYYAVTSATVGTYTVKLNVKLGSGSTDDQWAQMTMTKLTDTYTYNGITYDVYKQEYSDWNDKIYTMQFQLYNGDQYVSQQQPYGSETAVATYNNKIYVHNLGWHDSHTLYFQADPADEESWSHTLIWDNGVKKNMTAGGSNYQFLLVQSYSTWYKTNSDNAITSTNNSVTLGTGGSYTKNVQVTPSEDGDYLFTLNTTTKEVTVTYPGSYSRSLTNAWGTICLPYAVTSANRVSSNAKYYSISYVADSKLYLKEETGDLVAGQPYIFEYQGSVPGTLSITCDVTASTINNNRGLIGTYSQREIESGKNYYIVQGGVVKAVSAGNVNIAANRAFIDMTVASGLTPILAPGLREIPLVPQSPTDIQSVDANEKTTKFFENGKLLIMREGVVYDATGRVVR